MTLDQLIDELQHIRRKHNGSLRVLVPDDDIREGDAPVIQTVKRQDGKTIVAIL